MSQMDSNRKVALLGGVFFIMTFIFSIPALFFYAPVLNHHDYILGSGADTRVTFGALFELISLSAGIGTAVALFPVLKRQSEIAALGYVAIRIIESGLILVGILSVLAVLTLRQDLTGATGAEAASLLITARSLVAIHDWTFLLGPAFCAGLGNGIVLGWLMYKSGLVPRQMALFGVIGGPICFVSAVAVLFGLYGQTSPINDLATLLEFIWELSLGIYLTVQGFKPSPVLPVLDGNGVVLRPLLQPSA